MKNLKIPLITILAIIVICIVVGIKSHQVSPKYAPPFRGPDAFVQREDYMHKLVTEKIGSVAEQADKDHVSKEERKRRVDAVYNRGLTEIKKVRASHGTLPFNENF